MVDAYALCVKCQMYKVKYTIEMFRLRFLKICTISLWTVYIFFNTKKNDFTTNKSKNVLNNALTDNGREIIL